MRKWNQTLFNEYFSRVKQLTPDDREIAIEGAKWVREQWAAKGKATLIQQKGLLAEFRNALKARLPENHIALQTMTFSTQEWIQVNRASMQRTAEQNQEQRILDPGTVNALVTRATNLLLSREWSDIAAGLALLTGRRATEVLKTGAFAPKTTFSVTFKGALKRKGEMQELSFEIPTLCAAGDVLVAWKKLRKIKPTKHLSIDQCNQFSNPVAVACDRHFSELVHPPAGRDTLYTHLFRKIYATIATYFYCPPAVDEAEYRAHIQGHFSGHEDLTLAERRSIASDRHYRSYSIQDEYGNSQKGTRLGWRGVEVLEEFKPTSNGARAKEPISDIPVDDGSVPDIPVDDSSVDDSPAETSPVETSPVETNPVVMDDRDMARETPIEGNGQLTMPLPTTPEKRRTTSPGPIWYDHKQRWGNVLDAIAPTQDATPDRKADRMAILLEWIEQRLEDPKRAQKVVPPPSTQDVEQGDILKAIAQLSAKVDRSGNAERIEELEYENELLRTERDLALNTLAQVRSLLGEQTTSSLVPEETVHALSSTPTPENDNNNDDVDTLEPPAVSPVTAPPQNTRLISAQGIDPQIVDAVETVMTYNDAQTAHGDKWTISYTVMRDLLATVGKATTPKIKLVFDHMKSQLDEHHAKHGLSSRHNRCHKDEKVTEFIKL